MSLLIPTENDRLDAHGNVEQEQIYRQLYSKRQYNKLPNGEYEFPWDFEVVPGFFKQSHADTDDLKFRYVEQDFGVAKPWKQIIDELNHLNETAKSDECYKLIFFARHGQGFHNVCVEKYGIDEWNNKWHALTTDGEILWAPDPMLTELGINQAKENNMGWKLQLSKGAPMPGKFFSSPLQRSCHTLNYTWSGIKPHDVPIQIDKLLRETIGKNLCDKRSPVSTIEERFAKLNFEIDESMTEEDTVFKNDVRETLPEQSFRANKFLQKLFSEPVENHQDNIVYTASHAGTIRAFITVLTHRHFTISTGGMIPMVIKGTKKN